jgi:hypothetical protein
MQWIKKLHPGLMNAALKGEQTRALPTEVPVEQISDYFQFLKNLNSSQRQRDFFVDKVIIFKPLNFLGKLLRRFFAWC